MICLCSSSMAKKPEKQNLSLLFGDLGQMHSLRNKQMKEKLILFFFSNPISCLSEKPMKQPASQSMISKKIIRLKPTVILSSD